ncbi:MAG TPA: hypothetical protein VLG76_01120 [Rhabdochlamydiaceae bacterium]|nr:hypothetical protein [Rhabdochlamydiaceae bacterium]
MAEIEGSGSITPQQKAVYKQEFVRGADLFKQSFNEYLSADNDNKKTLLKDVMERALQVMNETAKYALSQKKLEQENKLEQDFDNFISNESPESTKELQNDIDKLQKGL